MKFALVKDGLVVNIIRADNTDFLDSLVGLGEIDSYLLTDDTTQIGDTVTAGVITRTLPLLAVAKATKLSDFNTAVQDYLDLHYPFRTRIQLFNLYTLSRLDGLTNRAAYLQACIDWINSTMDYSVQFATHVNAQVDSASVIDLTWDFTGIAVSDPHINLGTAIQILD